MNQKDIETLAIALPEDILKAKWCGDFNRAFHLIDLYLANEKVPAFMKTRLALEREVLKALPTGYTYSEEDALALVQKEIPDFTKAELDALRDRGAIDWIYINGKTTYSRTFYDTLLGVYPDIATRAGKPPKDKSDRVEFLRQNVRDMKKDRLVNLHYGDMTDSSSLIRIIQQIQPDEIYNLAAQSHVKVSFDVPEYTAEADAVGTLRMLEAVRILGLTHKTKIYQASTSELYGKVQEVPQKETTPFYPRSPYGVAKQYGFWITKNYRESYGMFAVNGILFNHESERRGETFVTRKITLAAARIAHGQQDKLYLGNLDARRDWGYARDYVECMWMILQHDSPEDFVIATDAYSS